MELGVFFEGQPQAVFKRDQGDVVQGILGFADIRAHSRDAAAYPGVVDLFGFTAGDINHLACQFAHAGFLPAANIDHFTVQTLSGGGCDQGIDHIVHIDIIASLVAIAVEDQGAVLFGLADEIGDDWRVGGGNPLAWPIGVENPQNQGFNAGEITDRADVPFCCQFGCCIWGLRMG